MPAESSDDRNKSNDAKDVSSNNVSQNLYTNEKTTKPKRKVRESANSSGNSSVTSIYNNPDDFVRYRHLEMTSLSNQTSPIMMNPSDEHDNNIDKLMEVFSSATVISETSQSKDDFEDVQMMVPQSNNNNNNINNNNLMSDVYVDPEKQQQAQRYREIGNEFFKKGQFSDAASQYSLAIQELPQGHRDLIPIYNNRSIAYIKTGHYKECVNDCNIVQSIDSKDVKSLIRRATAYEHLEKWKLALADYKKIQTLDSSYTIVNQAITRCKKAMHVEANENSNSSYQPSNSSSSTPVRVNRKLQSDIINAQQKAMEKLKKNEEKLKAEENERFRIKDQVDEKIMLWSKGKENNIRALIASMDMILWPELKWKNMNLADLISPQKVKIGYMKAIAKVHPDKIRNDETVEHKMIATSAFGILNTAWDSFKEQNGL